jgi:arylamine N-acetyltransferase
MSACELDFSDLPRPARGGAPGGRFAKAARRPIGVTTGPDGAATYVPPGSGGRPACRPESTVRYLRRLGLDDPGAPSIDGLRALHRAHVERVPYEALDIQMGRPTSVDSEEVVSRVLRGRGGYCVQLNTAFSALLTALGYRVTWHRSGVQGSPALPHANADFAPHLAPTVELDGEDWLVDVGLGDALIEPLPLRPGVHRHGPMTFRIVPSQVEEGGWRFEHDPRGSIGGLDIRTSAATTADFAEWHPYLATSPESRLVRAAVVLRRDAAGVDALMGCMLRRIDGTGKTVRELATAAEWFGALADVFGLPLNDVGDDDRNDLWAKVRGGHEAWLAAKAARSARPAEDGARPVS